MWINLLFLRSVARMCLVAMSRSFLRCATSGGHNVNSPNIPFTNSGDWLATVSYNNVLYNIIYLSRLLFKERAYKKSINTAILVTKTTKSTNLVYPYNISQKRKSFNLSRYKVHKSLLVE